VIPEPTAEVTPIASLSSSSDSLSPYQPGDRVGRYEVVETIGAGGMGFVFRARDPELGRDVALKLLRPRGSRVGNDAAAEARLVREAQAMARLSHPNVLPVYDIGVVDGRVFIGMEYVEGETLWSWLSARRRSWLEIVDLFRQAGQGLVAAHDAGILHRDFKPSNVVIGRDGRPRVLDFGLAHFAEEGRGSSVDRASSVRGSVSGSGSLSEELTEAGTVMGTVGYMAPEQHEGGVVDERADQFAFCVALYRALFGMSPFPGDDANAIIEAKSSGRPAPPPSDSGVPAYVRRALMRGLRAAPHLRFGTMTDLLDALSARRGRRAVRWGAAIVALGAVTGATVGGQQEKAGCADEGDLDGIWDGSAREAARVAVTGVDSPIASDTWQRISPRLDAYADQWRAHYQKACAALADNPSSGSERQMQCLLDSQAEFGSFSHALLGADPEFLVVAIRRANTLQSELEDCLRHEREDVGYLPPDPNIEAEVERVRQALRQVGTMTTADEFEASRDALFEAYRAAENIGYAPLEAEAALRVGSVLIRHGHIGDGERYLEQAYFTAERSGHRRVALSAARTLVGAVGIDAGRTADGLEWTRHLEAMLGDDATVVERATLLDLRGTIQFQAGEISEGIAMVRSAVEMLEAEGERDVQAAMSRNNLCMVLTEGGEHEEALAQCQAAAHEFELVYGPQHPRRAWPYINMGITYQKLDRYEESEAATREALKLLRASFGPDHPRTAMTTMNLANALYLQGDYDGAAELHEHALKVLEATVDETHPSLQQARLNLAVVRRYQGRPAESEQLLNHALETAERLNGSTHYSVGTIMQNLGNLAYEAGDYELALIRFERARGIFTTSLSKEVHPRVAGIYRRIGNSKRHLGRIDEALDDLERSLAIYDEIDGYRPERGEVLFDIATTLDEAGREPERARQLAEQARPGFLKGGAPYGEKIAELDRWLAQHS
jgi:tetratricopeptide (TPR) repeat protein/tRNA A-37 threonylcarbamoyl transferase component Bud32